MLYYDTVDAIFLFFSLWNISASKSAFCHKPRSPLFVSRRTPFSVFYKDCIRQLSITKHHLCWDKMHWQNYLAAVVYKYALYIVSFVEYLLSLWVLTTLIHFVNIIFFELCWLFQTIFILISIFRLYTYLNQINMLDSYVQLKSYVSFFHATDLLAIFFKESLSFCMIQIVSKVGKRA